MVLVSAQTARSRDAAPTETGTIVEESFSSAVAQAGSPYLVYLPAGYAAAAARFPVIYLLHGRGDTMRAWREIRPDLDRLIAEKKIPPVVAIMPEAPWSRRGGYYVDSQFDGGAATETAFTRDLIAHIDAKFRTRPERAARIIAGYSMGGYGALRFALAHSELFGAAIVLSPAVYVPLPPADSSKRAFGREAKLFDEQSYTAANYPALIPPFVAKGLPLVMFIAVGDDEKALTDPNEAMHDLDYEAHTLYNRVRRVPGITAQLRVVDGPHDWATWRPTFAEGIQYVFAQLAR